MSAVNPIYWQAERLNRRDWLTLGLILLIAAVMRFSEMGMVEFFHDEAMLSMLAQDMAAGKTFPTEGILSSVGIPNPPTSVYVMWLPYRLSNDPLFATMFIAALNLIGVGLLWFFAHRYFNRTVALIAGLAYSLNPWAILYSRKIWAQDFHTPFVLLAILLGVYGFWEGKRWAQILCLPILLFALQIHFAAWALLPLYFFVLWMGRQRISWKALAVSAVLSLLVMLPYIIGLSQTLQQDPTRITDTVGRSGVNKGLSFSGDALVYNARLATGLGLETWVAPEQQENLLASVPAPFGLWMIVGLFTLMGIGYVLLANVMILNSRMYRTAGLLIFLWVALPIVIFTPTWTQIYPHYFIAGIPPLALLTGIGIEQVIVALKTATNRNPIVSKIILAGFAFILITQGIWWRGLMRYLDSTNTPLGYTTPIHYLLPIRDQLAGASDVLIVSDGMEVLFDKEPARWSVLLRDRVQCLRTIKGDGFALFPSRPFAAVIAPNAPENPVNNLYMTDAPMIFPDRRGEGEYRVYHFDVAPEWNETGITSIEPAAFDSGVILTGYYLDETRMVLEWQLPNANTQINYQYSGHFLDANGERLSQKDTLFLMGRHWCGGDRLITWTDVALPEDTAILRVGLYQLGKGRTTGQYFSANVLDALGNPAGQWVDISVVSNE